MQRKISRRMFLFGTAVTTGSIAGGGCFPQSTGQSHSVVSKETGPSSLPPPVAMPERILGKTGVKVPILGLGGAGQTPLSHIGTESQSIALIERAIQLGIRYFDTAASYGPSEDYLGRVLPAYRPQVFLASKTAARDRDGAWRELEQSLQRLQTNYLDLWQLHHVSYPEDLEQIFGRNGAIEAIAEAKAQKLIRFSGVTGHHEPAVIAEALQRYSFDATLIALNAADRHHPRPFAELALPVARQLQLGVIAMKVPAYGRLFRSGTLDGMHQAMGYSLSLPGVHCCVIAAENPAQLEQNVAIARQYHPLSPVEMAAIEQRTLASWQENTFFRTWG